MLSRFITAAFSATIGERKASVSSSTETPTTKAMTTHSRSSSSAVMSASTGVAPVTCTPSGSDVGPQVGQQLRGGLVGRRRGRLQHEDGGAAGGRQDRLPHPGHAGHGDQLVAELGELVRRDGVEVDGHQERTVGARPEGVGDQVVGLAGGRLGRLGADVGGPQPQVGDRCGEGEQEQQGTRAPTAADGGRCARPSGRRTGASSPSGPRPGGPSRGSTRCFASPRTAGTTVSAAAMTLTTPIAVAMPKVA